MAYFHKKSKPEPSFNNHFDQSSVSNSADDCLVVNSNIFNKSQHQQPNPKQTHPQNSHSKSPSTSSYLKNFKKNYHKSNQENIFTGEPSREDSSFAKPSLLKQDYELMMNELMGGQVMKENNRSSSSRLSHQSKKQSKNKISHDEEKNSYKNNHQNSLTNHLFLNDQSEQSMEELLNSSINQFERFLQQEQEIPQATLYEKNQNMNLKKTLTKFKSILKQKLEHGLNKQKQEMKSMLNEYVELITKLLHDKEELSNHIEELEQELNSKTNDVGHYQRKVEEINKEKDDHIQKTKQQIDEFLVIIEQFQSEAKQQNERIEEMERQIERLRPFEEQAKNFQNRSSHKKYSSQEFQDQEKRIECQSEKIQTLLELLEKSQQQTNTLKQILSKQNSEMASLKKELTQKSSALKSQPSRGSNGQVYQFTQRQVEEMKALYEQKLEELEIEHEQEFIEYEKAIKETLTKKDECIQRLNFIITELREGKKSGGRNKYNEDSRPRGLSEGLNTKFVQKQNKQVFDQQMNSMNDNTFNEEEPIQQEESIRR